MEFLKWIISISYLIGIFTSPFAVPLQALVYKIVKGTPYLHTLYYCGVRSMKIQRILFYIVVPAEFIFVLSGGFQASTNNSNIKTIFIMAIATLFSYGFLVLWENFFRRKLREYNQKLKVDNDRILDDDEEASENQNNNSNTQEKKTYINDFLPEGSERKYKKPSINQNLKVILYTLLFFFVIAPLLIFTIESFKISNTVPSSKQPTLDEINADIRRAMNTPKNTGVPTSDVSGVQIELSNFGLKYEYKSGNVSAKYINFKVQNLRSQQINGAIFKIQLYDIFDRMVCFTGIENSTVGFDKALEFQKTINPNTSDIVQVEVPFECQNLIDPTKQHKYSITILRVV